MRETKHSTSKRCNSNEMWLNVKRGDWEKTKQRTKQKSPLQAYQNPLPPPPQTHSITYSLVMCQRSMTICMHLWIFLATLTNHITFTCSYHISVVPQSTLHYNGHIVSNNWFSFAHLLKIHIFFLLFSIFIYSIFRCFYCFFITISCFLSPTPI